MKKVILGAFLLLAAAGTTMAQTAKKDTSSMKSGKTHGKMHHKMHHKMSKMKSDSTGTQK